MKSKETAFELRDVDDLIPSGNDVADAFDNVSDYTKEITRYGEPTRKGTRLTNEISAILNVQMPEFIQKIKEEDLEFENKQFEFIQSLSIWFKQGVN